MEEAFLLASLNHEGERDEGATEETAVEEMVSDEVMASLPEVWPCGVCTKTYEDLSLAVLQWPRYSLTAVLVAIELKQLALPLL